MSHTLRALSFDADNCLFHAGYEPEWSEIESNNCEQVVTENKTLLDELKAQNPYFKETIVLVGSLRQSVKIDEANARRNQTESFFVAIPKVAEYLEATLDKFLTSDIHDKGVNVGTAFELATKNPSAPQPTCFIDESKLSLLYAQTHKLATDYPNEHILFEFYDDRGCGTWEVEVDILEKLQAYFTQHPEALPSNITLRLNHYDGGHVTRFSEIQGAGFIDTNYPKTAKQIANLTCAGKRALSHAEPSQLSHRTSVVLKNQTSFLPVQAPPPAERISGLITQYLGSFFYYLGYSRGDEQNCISDIDQQASGPKSSDHVVGC